MNLPTAHAHIYFALAKTQSIFSYPPPPYLYIPCSLSLALCNPPLFPHTPPYHTTFVAFSSGVGQERT